ncbi:hypothetical protein [Pseudomonas sp. QTF5]|uniref:SpaN/EivJ family type III secretion system needle length determinant n=1 Tax=Pseudomonas sp. QTF5 TaxID=1435425 RepID=UPI0004BE30B5|nr:hypothetical protein [Pseudomonas sp. QTF5]
MREMSVVPRLPASVEAPGHDGPVDELKDKLIPVEEDELPQGLLDLAAALLVRHRPMMGTGRHDRLPPAPSSSAGIIERHDLQAQVEVPAAQGRSASRQMEPVLSAMERVTIPASTVEAPLPLPRTNSAPQPLSPQSQPQPLPQSQPLPDRLSRPMESAPVDLSPPPGKPAVADNLVDLPEALPVAQAPRSAPTMASPVTVPSATLPPSPPSDITLEEAAGASRNFLQIPFSKGTASGQVTITRLPGEFAQNLVLNPSNPQVLEHLREPFDQVRESHWRLADTADEQSRHGSRQSPDDEQEEQQEHPA